MKRREYIVLQRARLIAPEAGGLAAAIPANLDAEMPAFTLGKVEMTPAERLDMLRDPRTQAVAQAMPMRLFEPVEAAEVAAGPSAAATWGVEAVLAMSSPFDGSGITVAVLDTGIDPNHQAFQGVQLLRKNFTTEADDDLHGHGTHCAGTIFGKDVGGSRIGVARNVGKALIGKVLGAGGGSSLTIAEAINWAVTEGANVISMSLGIDFTGFVDSLVNEEGLDVRPATSLALEQYRANINLFSALAGFVRTQSTFGEGCILVAASGNESERPTYEIAVSPPAAGNEVIAVGALQQGAQGFSVARFSNTQVNVSAPGVGVISARRGGGLVSMSGTSMATPHVAGVAALWAQKLKQTTGRVEPRRLMALLIGRATTDPLDPMSTESDVGSGIVQSPQT